MYLMQADVNKFKEELIPGKADLGAIDDMNEKILSLQKRMNTQEVAAGKQSSGSIGAPANYAPISQTNTEIVNRIDVLESTLSSLERSLKTSN